MIHAEANEGKVKCTMAGTIADILTDLLQVINTIYKNISKNDEAVGEAVKFAIKSTIADDTCPVWQIKEKSGTKQNHSIPKLGVVQLKGTESKEQVAQCVSVTLRSMGIPEDAIEQIIKDLP